MKFMYPAVFRKNEDGTYNGYFPDLECCTSTGDTLDEAIENANEAAYNWITVELDEEELATRLLLAENAKNIDWQL